MPSERKSICDMLLMPYLAPGASTSRWATASFDELDTIAWASASSCEKLPRTANRTSTNIRPAPAMSSTALTICT